MPLVPLDIPAGVYRNGTEYESKGRWFDTNLVRWHEGRLQPVGGWEKFDSTQSAYDGKARGLLAWRGNDGGRFIAVGTNEKLYASQGGQFYDASSSSCRSRACLPSSSDIQKNLCPLTLRKGDHHHAEEFSLSNLQPVTLLQKPER